MFVWKKCVNVALLRAAIKAYLTLSPFSVSSPFVGKPSTSILANSELVKQSCVFFPI